MGRFWEENEDTAVIAVFRKRIPLDSEAAHAEMRILVPGFSKKGEALEQRFAKLRKRDKRAQEAYGEL